MHITRGQSPQFLGRVPLLYMHHFLTGHTLHILTDRVVTVYTNDAIIEGRFVLLGRAALLCRLRGRGRLMRARGRLMWARGRLMRARGRLMRARGRLRRQLSTHWLEERRNQAVLQ